MAASAKFVHPHRLPPRSPPSFPGDILDFLLDDLIMAANQSAMPTNVDFKNYYLK